MALSIGVRRGMTIRIGGAHDLKIEDVLGTDRVRVSFGDRELLITDLERTILMKDVYVQCGTGRNDTSYTRLAFEAPREIRIERV